MVVQIDPVACHAWWCLYVNPNHYQLLHPRHIPIYKLVRTSSWNIAKGTTDSGTGVISLNSATSMGAGIATYLHLIILEACSPVGATCIGCKFVHLMAQHYLLASSVCIGLESARVTSAGSQQGVSLSGLQHPEIHGMNEVSIIISNQYPLSSSQKKLVLHWKVESIFGRMFNWFCSPLIRLEMTTLRCFGWALGKFTIWNEDDLQPLYQFSKSEGLKRNIRYQTQIWMVK